MDGSSAAFLLHPTEFSSLAEPAGGILYIEDFDLEPNLEPDLGRQDISQPQVAESAFTLADLAAAREEGRQIGINAAVQDATLLQTEIQAAATQSLADALGTAHAELAKIVRQSIDDAVRIMLGILQAAVPALMDRHADGEIAAVLRALLPDLSPELDLRLRSHPGAADSVRDLVAALLPHDMARLSITADPALATGDVQVTWRCGSATRDTGQIWTDIRVALAALSLPTIEELCRGQGC